ncbi:hypothetical protein ACH5RR_008684 [Cinchona calisaya]|uniref:Uncharacterized protein n=1 Tax=Cinchona calisaya TaxID=153742 RepID=A0ABD3ACB6_9GENT
MAPLSFSASYLLFGGLVFFNFTAVSLIIVCCSRRIHSRNLANDDNRQEEVKPQEQLPGSNVDEACPEQIVVIMAGDQTPSFLAMPAPSPRPCFPEEQV